MLTLLLVRHGDAEPQIDGKNDRDRKLIKKGIKQMRRIANFIDEMGYTIDRILSSPYLRAYQSAEVILDELGIDDKKVETFDELSPDSDPSTFLQRIKEFNDNSTIMIVGHEPFLSKFINLISGGQVEIKKGGLAVLEYDMSQSKGELKLLLNQKVLKLI